MSARHPERAGDRSGEPHDFGAKGEEAVHRLLSLQRPEESDAEFARRLGIQPQILSNYKNGHHGLSLKTALRVHSMAGISLDWLLTGTGSPDTVPGGGANRETPFRTGATFVFAHLARSLHSLLESLELAGAVELWPETRKLQQALADYLEAEAGQWAPDASDTGSDFQPADPPPT